jgi:beta-glucanase (GH16 family)
MGSDEIDVTEMPGWPGGSNDNQHVNQQIHSMDAAGSYHQDGCTAATTDVSKNWHVYQLVWQPGLLVWKVDGMVTCTISASYVPSTPMFLIINTAIGSASQINNAALPQSMSIDYVRVTN